MRRKINTMMTATPAASKRRPVDRPAPACCAPDEREPCIVCLGTERRDVGEPIPPRPSDVELDPWDVECDPEDWPADVDNWYWAPTPPWTPTNTRF
jgi:hypothetical protein